MNYEHWNSRNAIWFTGIAYSHLHIPALQMKGRRAFLCFLCSLNCGSKYGWIVTDSIALSPNGSSCGDKVFVARKKCTAFGQIPSHFWIRTEFMPLKSFKGVIEIQQMPPQHKTKDDQALGANRQIAKKDWHLFKPHDAWTSLKFQAFFVMLTRKDLHPTPPFSTIHGSLQSHFNKSSKIRLTELALWSPMKARKRKHVGWCWIVWVNRPYPK